MRLRDWGKTKKCLDCGYLYTFELTRRTAGAIPDGSFGRTVSSYEHEIAEIAPEDRSKDAITKNRILVYCFRHALEPVKTTGDARWNESAEAVSRNRKCSWFYRYIPSHLPSEHLVLQDRAEDRREHMKGYLGSAVLGGVLSGAMAVIAILLTAD